ncbi:MAG: hypothetical protein O7B99_10645, partial [Planctomycetota bacterium]|nr:hypothetical protein [Planctomycetota bacterium]
LCVYPCPKDCIHMGTEFAFVSFDRSEFNLDLLSYKGMAREAKVRMIEAEKKKAAKEKAKQAKEAAQAAEEGAATAAAKAGEPSEPSEPSGDGGGDGEG